MAKERVRSAVVTAGQFSDGESSPSLEEIAAEDYKMPTVSSGVGSGVPPRAGVWMGYRMPRNYGPALSNFAWAQAVQNKPLGIELAQKDAEAQVLDESDDDGKASSTGEEKEEGELEEGEIGFGDEIETAEKDTVTTAAHSAGNEGAMIDIHREQPEEEKGASVADTAEAEEEDIGDVDRKVNAILEDLETVTVEEAQKSFDAACSTLKRSFEKLRPMFQDSGSPLAVLDVLVQQAFVGIQAIQSVLSSDTSAKKESNKNTLLKLLFHLKNQYSKLLTPDQLNELDSSIQSLVFDDEGKSNMANFRGRGHAGTVLSISSSIDQPGTSSTLLTKPLLQTSRNLRNPGLAKLDIPRKVTSPLLDLHADYDESNLPSPTQQTSTVFPIPEPISFGATETSFSQQKPAEKIGACSEPPVHTYITDAVQAVSSYQQKFGHRSFISGDLPSPTPSEGEGNGNCAAGDEAVGEVSSRSVKAVPTMVTNPLPLPGFVVGTNISGSLSAGQSVSGFSNPDLKPQLRPASRSRDPRLRTMISGPDGNLDPNARTRRDTIAEAVQNPRKYKLADEVSASDSVVKRQRTGIAGAAQATPQPSPPPVASLPSVLKNLHVSAATLIQLLQQGQKCSTVDTLQNSSAPAVLINPSVNNAFGVSSLPTLPLVKSTDTNVLAAVKPAQTTSGMISQPEVKIRMKPRDPRRVLHGDVAQKSEMVTKANGNLKVDTVTVRDVVERAQMASFSSQPVDVSCMVRQPHNNMKGSADTTVPAAATPTPIQIAPTQASPVVPIVTSPMDLNGLKNSPKVASALGTNPWGDVEHLLDGFDDEEKAAIQMERARRIEEQNKMFASRKLCLVLDLDHTLLNSAKFTEVEPIHDEILRKKEEQDREKVQRHLFHFQHMGMWTKLRPGIWNFLEKASKLFELHLYTMGNKLYATEMAKVLDPSGALFSGRVISRGDDSDSLDSDDRVPKSKDLDGVLGMESAVVIIDDSVKVWPHNRHNLIVVERYTYFPCSRKQFGLNGPSLLEIDHDERPEDGTLASSLAVIERIHQIFFAHRLLNEADVRAILAAEQRKILAGCRIVFSRIFPVGEANPHMHPLWQVAEQFGATCTTQIDEQVTHVVANSLGTDKVNWALSKGKFVVYPGWVEASALLYRRANELDFAVKQ